MFKQQVMNSKEVSSILKKLKEQFDIEFSKDYYFFKNNKNRVFIISKKLQYFELDKIRVNELGLYFLTIEEDGLRLSIEGSQLLRNAKKNIISLNEKQFLDWMKGFDINIDDERNGYMLVKFGTNFCGCGKLANGVLYNFVPKARRVK